MKGLIPTKKGAMVISVVLLLLVLINYVIYKATMSGVGSVKNNFDLITESRTCEPKAYAGKAQIKAWTIEEESVVRISEEDKNKLPDKGVAINDNKIKIIDITPEVKEKMQKATEESPEKLTITGLAMPCSGGMVLASISYKEGIFRPFLK